MIKLKKTPHLGFKGFLKGSFEETLAALEYLKAKRNKKPMVNITTTRKKKNMRWD